MYGCLYYIKVIVEIMIVAAVMGKELTIHFNLQINYFARYVPVLINYFVTLVPASLDDIRDFMCTVK